MRYYNNHNRYNSGHRTHAVHHNHGGGGHGGHSDSSHQTFLQKLLRSLIALFSSVGFTMLWYAIAVGISNCVLHFIFGIILVLIGIFHIFIGIKKDCTHRRGY